MEHLKEKKEEEEKGEKTGRTTAWEIQTPNAGFVECCEESRGLF